MHHVKVMGLGNIGEGEDLEGSGKMGPAVRDA
jgi:hypothetical protein